MKVSGTPVTRTVTSTADGGPGSLRQAIADSAPGDCINFLLPWPATLKLTNRLVLDKNLTLLGPGPAQLTVMRDDAPGTANFRVFHVRTGAVMIADMTIRNGRVVTSGDNAGAGILNQGSLVLSNCVITGNEAPSSAGGNGFGGGIFSFGPLALYQCLVQSNTATWGGGGVMMYYTGGFVAENSTFHGNMAGLQGGGLNLQNATGSMRRCTISGNTAGDFGGGGGILNIGWPLESGSLVLEACTVTGNSGETAGGVCTVVVAPGSGPVTTKLRNTLVAGNTGPNFLTEAPARLISLGHNFDSEGTSGFVHGVGGDLVGTTNAPLNALLGPLRDNGGLTPTHALLAGSPAVDAGSCLDSAGLPLGADQRGVPRPQGPACDIGACENTAPGACPVTVSGTNTFPRVIAWTYSDLENNPQAGFQVEVWTQPGGTGTAVWTPPPFAGGAASVFYAGPTLAPTNTYFVRVRVADGIYWGDWCEALLVPRLYCGDFNRDGAVDIRDFTLFRAHYGKRRGQPGYLEEADYDGDGVGDLHDYAIWYGCYRFYVLNH